MICEDSESWTTRWGEKTKKERKRKKNSKMDKNIRITINLQSYGAIEWYFTSYLSGAVKNSQNTPPKDCKNRYQWVHVFST